MNYLKLYESLILKAKSLDRKNREAIYYESHHIIPKCIDKNSKETVLLTGREHFIAHKILVKVYPESRGLANAYWRMSTCGRYITRNSKDYQEARILHSVYHSVLMKSLKNKLHTIESKAKIGEAHKNKIVSIETRKLMSEKKVGLPSPNLGKTFSEEWRKNLSKGKLGKELLKLRGVKHSPERIEANRQRALNEKIDNLCPYCNKLFRIQTFSQFHGEKCKSRAVTDLTV